MKPRDLVLRSIITLTRYVQGQVCSQYKLHGQISAIALLSLALRKACAPSYSRNAVLNFVLKGNATGIYCAGKQLRQSLTAI
ncbi:hypothetical protein D3C85_1565180 [compost metagenome]